MKKIRNQASAAPVFFRVDNLKISPANSMACSYIYSSSQNKCCTSVLTTKIKNVIANYQKISKIQRKKHSFKQQVALDEHEIAMTI